MCLASSHLQTKDRAFKASVFVFPSERIQGTELLGNDIPEDVIDQTTFDLTISLSHQHAAIGWRG